MDKNLTFSIVTLGCKVNQYDSWQLARQLKAAGFKQVPFGALSDVTIVNSCAVTHVAEAKSRKVLARARRANPQGFIVFTGCTAELMLQRGIYLEHADLIVGNKEKEHLVERICKLLEEHKSISLFPENHTLNLHVFENNSEVHERVRAFLKVQDGCDKFCTFCVVPFTRGMPRSKSPSQVLEEAEELVYEFGFPEIVLTGVCLTSWGREFGLGLADLIERLHNIDGLKRIRLSSLDPCDIDERLIRTCAELPKVCHHFHLPLQSGDDEILKAMGRGYTCEQFHKVAETFRKFMPDSAFTTDIMVGFPGETETHFKNTLRFIGEVGFMRLHVFKYSLRPNTKAAELNNTVSSEVADKRAQQLIELSKELWQEFASRFVGTRQIVLIERCSRVKGSDDGFIASGLTSNYLRVNCRVPNPVSLGSLLTVEIIGIEPEKGEVLACIAGSDEKVETWQPRSE